MREQEITYHGPFTPWEQPEVSTALYSDSQREEWRERAEKLQEEILSLMEEKGIEVSELALRLKSPARIRDKLKRAKTHGKGDWPMADIYGVRLILTKEEEMPRAVAVIQEKWPTPERFPWGLETLRMGKNRYSDRQYRNIYHLNIVFGEGGEKLGEIQLLVKEDEEVLEITRRSYEKAQVTNSLGGRS